MRRLEFIHILPATIEEVWAFFSSPENLSKITPPEMGFIITSPTFPAVYAGMFITYKVKPLLGIKLNWVTEITQSLHQQYFIDEQRSGPYSIWHHEHHFRPVNGGVEMKDILFYKVPFGFLGRLADIIFVKNKVNSIFSYRGKRILELFPAKGN